MTSETMTPSTQNAEDRATHQRRKHSVAGTREQMEKKPKSQPNDILTVFMFSRLDGDSSAELDSSK
jgi:hypothetical protein